MIPRAKRTSRSAAIDGLTHTIRYCWTLSPDYIRAEVTAFFDAAVAEARREQRKRKRAPVDR